MIQAKGSDARNNGHKVVQVWGLTERASSALITLVLYDVLYVKFQDR